MGRKRKRMVALFEKKVLSTAFIPRYRKGIEQLLEFGIKNSLTLPSLTNKYFISLRDENDGTIYNYNDDYIRDCTRRSVKLGVVQL